MVNLASEFCLSCVFCEPRYSYVAAEIMLYMMFCEIKSGHASRGHHNSSVYDLFYVIIFFYFFFNSGVCLDRKILGIRTFSFSEYWRFERKTLFALISHRNECCFRGKCNRLWENRKCQSLIGMCKWTTVQRRCKWTGIRDWRLTGKNSTPQIGGGSKRTNQWNKIMKW